MKIWVDDVRYAPEGHLWCKSVNETKDVIEFVERVFGEYNPSTGEKKTNIELIDLDYDAGDYAERGGNYINLLYWLEETGKNYPIHIHSADSVGAEEMREIIQRNGWTEVVY